MGKRKSKKISLFQNIQPESPNHQLQPITTAELYVRFSQQGEIMGKLHLNSGAIQDFDIQEVTEPSGHIVAHVKIDTDRDVVKYRVSTDDRHPKLTDIVNKLQNGLQTAKNSDADFQISEYCERNYIFVTYPNSESEQYTGSRIEI